MSVKATGGIGQFSRRYMDEYRAFRSISVIDTAAPSTLTDAQVIDARGTRFAFDNVLHVVVSLPTGVTAATVEIYANTRVTSTFNSDAYTNTVTIDDPAAWCLLKSTGITDNAIITIESFPPGAIFVRVPAVTGTLSASKMIQVDCLVSR